MNKLIMLAGLTFVTNAVMASPNLQEATTDVCGCLKEPHSASKQAVDLMMKARSTGDMTDMMSAQDRMMSVVNESTHCFEALVKKYPEIDKSEKLQKQVMVMAEKQCPNPAEKFSQKR